MMCNTASFWRFLFIIYHFAPDISQHNTSCGQYSFCIYIMTKHGYCSRLHICCRYIYLSKDGFSCVNIFLLAMVVDLSWKCSDEENPF